jgi:phospholipid-binding lipoprotein MlaA
MKPIVLAACLVLFLWPARAAQKPAAESSPVLRSGIAEGGPPAVRPANEEEKPFQDPFASDQAKAQPRIKDPLQPMNRAFFHFNDKLYFWVLKPASKGYSTVVPRPARTCVGHFFANVKYPIYLVNNLLQGKFKSAGLETSRFVVNSTVGIAGFFDPATHWKLQAHQADFDQTLGCYGLGPGIYFDWPVFGPSSPRGTAGLLGDGALSPWMYVGGAAVVYAVPAYREVNGASLRTGEYESFKKATLDPYVAMRSAYYQNRAELVAKSKD